jgi:hypothetical protein
MSKTYAKRTTLQRQGARLKSVTALVNVHKELAKELHKALPQ